MSESNQARQQHKRIMQSTKGIGEVISSSLLVLLPELSQVSNKAIAAIAGVAPYNKDSGRYRGQRRIWGGRAMVRSLLYMATLSALRANPPIKALYEHLLSKGKAKKVAIVACMRKLLICLNSMVRHNQTWDDNKVSVRY
ncbi:MAG: transposase [Cyanobacteria bacterium P01_D01_bin.2]